MDSGELIELFYNRTYEKFVNKQILDDKNYVVPRQQLTNYVRELVNIPYDKFIEFIRHKDLERRVEESDVTQFTSFPVCEIEMCNALIWANNPGCQYLDIGRFFPNNIIAKSDSSYRRYGENHIKASSQLGLTFEYYDYWYLSCLGYIYPDLDEDIKIKLLARTITRNQLYQQMLVDILDHDVNPEVYMNMLPEYIKRRSLRSVCAYLNICILACKEADIKTHNLIRSYETIRIPSAVHLPVETSKNLRTYFEEFDYRSLSMETTSELIKRYKKGDSKAYEILVKGYMKLVVNIAKSYYNQDVELEDLIQEGVFGLIRAFEHYNVNVNISFSKYASWWIMQAISQAIIILPQIVKIPIKIIALHKKVRSYIDTFEQEQGYLPSVDDIEFYFYDNNDNACLNYICQLPLDLKDTTQLICDFDNYESDTFNPEIIHDKEFNCLFLKRLLHSLGKREQEILIMFYGLDGNQNAESLTNIADSLGLTRERVRQIVEKSIRKLRNQSGEVKGEEPKLGDFIRLEFSEQVGKVINIKKEIDASTILVLEMDSGKTKEVSTNYTLYRILHTLPVKKKKKNIPSSFDAHSEGRTQTKKESQTQSELEVQREVTMLDGLKVGDRIRYRHKDCTICKILVRGKTPRFLVRYNNDVLDYVPNSNSLYKKLPSQSEKCNDETKVNEAKQRNIKETLVGKRILYDNVTCTVIEEREIQNSFRLIVKYDNGTIDNLINDKNRYQLISQEKTDSTFKDLTKIIDYPSTRIGQAEVGNWVIRTSDNLVGRVVDIIKLKGGVEKLVLDLKDGSQASVFNKTNLYRILL